MEKLRSMLVTPDMLREFEEFQRDSSEWQKFWKPFKSAERDLFVWASKRNQVLAEHVQRKHDLEISAARDVLNSMNEAFLVGMYFGERRQLTSHDNFDWLKEACDEILDRQE